MLAEMTLSFRSAGRTPYHFRSAALPFTQSGILTSSATKVPQCASIQTLVCQGFLPGLRKVQEVNQMFVNGTVLCSRFWIDQTKGASLQAIWLRGEYALSGIIAMWNPLASAARP